jgi:archaellum component FlaC
MTTVTDSDLKELKEFLNGRFDKLEAQIQKIDALDKKLDIHIAKTDERLKGIDSKLTQLDKRIDSVDTRLNTFMIGFLSIIGIMVTGILGIIGKVVFFPNP